MIDTKLPFLTQIIVKHLYFDNCQNYYPLLELLWYV